MKHFLYILTFFIIMIATASHAGEIAIIVNEAYPADTISFTTLKEIYFGDKTTEGRVRIKPYDQENRETRKKFITKVLGISEDRYNAYWIKKVFQEGGIPPIMKTSSYELIMTIKEEVGGIGYVWKDEGNVSGIKILLIIEAGDEN